MSFSAAMSTSCASSVMGQPRRRWCWIAAVAVAVARVARAAPLEAVLTSRSGGSALRYAPHFYARAAADALLRELAAYPVNFTTYDVGGVAVRSPRAMLWCADDPANEYRFSANHAPGLRARPFTPTLDRVRADVERAVGRPFNAVLVNVYAGGAEHSGWHADDDPWLGGDVVVPSVSLGAERDFAVRAKGADADAWTMPLAHGSLAVMDGAFQDEYEHALPPAAGQTGVRINLTFRYVVPEFAHLHNMKPRWDSDATLAERLGDQLV